MNNILLQVQQYLDSVSKEPVKLDKQLVQEFGEACKNALLKQFEEERRDKFEPRMSNIGRPLCQLQMEAKNIKGEGQPYNAKMRNTFGDLIEALAIFVMKSAGVEIEDEQKSVKYNFNGSTLEGRYDVKIDKKVWDVKSASPYSFEKKFGPAGGFEEVIKDDAFGYASQGYLYSESEKVPFGGWIVINKSTGEWSVLETPINNETESNKILEQVEKDLHILNSDAPFKRLFEDIEETFNKKPTGNRILGKECTFCAYKKACWENLEYLPQQQSKAISPKYYWYTKVDNRREEHDDSSE